MIIITNWWAIIVSMIISVVLGFVWYGPLFGKKWMKASGISMPEKKPSAGMMVKPVIMALIGAFLMTVVLARAIVPVTGMFQTSGAQAGFIAAFWLWLGFIVPVHLSFVAWERKSWSLFLIHSLYWIVFLAIAGMIIASWS